MIRKDESMKEEVSIDLQQEGIVLQGTLTIPEHPKGLIIFAHGSGSSRFSPRNQHVARILIDNGLATLLLDLLTKEEDEIDQFTSQYRFDIPMLSERLVGATRWAKKYQKTHTFKIGYFGSSTGSAAALIAAATLGKQINAVVSRGGRPDLAIQVLNKVAAPVLLVVGGEDYGVIELNEAAFEQIHSEKKLEIVPGATHLFEEAGKLDVVAHLAAEWFKTKM